MARERPAHGEGAMIAAFDWWLLILGLVIGAGLTWLVVSESRRRDDDLDDAERASEAAWIAARLRRGRPAVDAALVEAVLDEHRLYLASPPPDPDQEPSSTAPSDVVAVPRGRPTAPRVDRGPEPTDDAATTADEPAPADAAMTHDEPVAVEPVAVEPATRDDTATTTTDEAATSDEAPTRRAPARRRRGRRSERAGEDGAVG